MERIVNTKDWRTIIAQCLIKGIPDSKEVYNLYEAYIRTTPPTEDEIKQQDIHTIFGKVLNVKVEKGKEYFANVNDIPTYFEKTYPISSTKGGLEDRIVKNQWDAVTKKCTATTIKKTCSKK